MAKGRVEIVLVGTITRKIDGPDREWLTRDQAAAWLGIGPDLFRELVRKGDLPRGARISHKVSMWHWRDVIAGSIALSWKRDTEGGDAEANGEAE